MTMTLAQTTQRLTSMWTPGEVAMLMTVFTTVVVAGIGAVIVKVIQANTNSRLAIIAAESAKEKATEAKTTSEHNERRMEGVQQQLTQVAMNQAPPPAAESPERLSAISRPTVTPWPAVRDVVDKPKGS